MLGRQKGWLWLAVVVMREVEERVHDRDEGDEAMEKMR